MKKVFIFIITILISASSFATGQVGDILIYMGNKYQLLDAPLEGHPNIDSIRLRFFGDRREEAGFNTSCWRAYVAEWTVEKDQIFLTNIYSCDYYNDSIKANLNEVFDDLCINGKVKADWISHELLVADGELIIYLHDGFRRFFEKEIGFFVENGKVVKIEYYDNSKSKKSEYFDNPKLLQAFIYSTVNWDSLPDFTNEKIRVLVTFSSGATETPENIYVVRGSGNQILDEEAKRVVSLLKWNVYYKKGKSVQISYTLPIVFSKENKLKYSTVDKENPK